MSLLQAKNFYNLSYSTTVFGEPGRLASSDSSTCFLPPSAWVINVVETGDNVIVTSPDKEVDEDCIVVLKKRWQWFYPKYLDMQGYVLRVGSFLGGGEDIVAEVKWPNGDVCYYETKMLMRVVEN